MQARGTHTWDDIAAGVFTGRYQLWPLERSVLVTEIVAYPRKRALNIFLAGGDMDELLAAVPKLADYGREHGCSGMVLTGRRGWLRVMGKHGWRQRHVTMEKEI